MSSLPRMPSVTSSALDDDTAASKPTPFPSTPLIHLLSATNASDIVAAVRNLLTDWLEAGTVDMWWKEGQTAVAEASPLARLARTVLEGGALQTEPGAAGRRQTLLVAAPLKPQGRLEAVLACEMPADRWTDASCQAWFAEIVALIEVRMQELRTIEDLRLSVASLEQAERL